MNKIVVANLKSSMNIQDVIDYLKEVNNIDNSDVIICPTYIYVPYFLKHKYKVGLQDISSNDISVTGDVLANQVASLGIKYSIVGHSDRSEKTDIINKKIINANKYGITSILCAGEEKQSKKTKKYIKQYLTECLKNTLVNRVIIAYEPVWAIGTNITPDNKYIEDMVMFIKDFIKKEFNQDIRVIYGGSISKENINTIKQIDNIDGILVGNVSTIPLEFRDIILKYLN